jgi:hypothetical protein
VGWRPPIAAGGVHLRTQPDQAQSKMVSPPSITIGGWQLKYDQDHHILYSANFGAGFWGLVTE